MKIIEDIENNEEQNLNKSISKETVPAAATEISEEAGTALTKASEVPVESGAPSDAAPEAEITEEADSALIAAPGAGSEMLEKQEPESEIADRADIEPKVASGNEGGMPEEETSADSKDEGTIELEGKEVSINTPADAINLGISIVMQEFNSMPHLPVYENIFLGHTQPDCLLRPEQDSPPARPS